MTAAIQGFGCSKIEWSQGYGTWTSKLLGKNHLCDVQTDNLSTLDYAVESEYQMFFGEEVTIAKGYISIIYHLASVPPQAVIQ
ncbi:hypothetical protein Bca101_043411 [Brassica carinata]